VSDERPRAIRIELTARTFVLALVSIAAVWLAVRLWNVVLVMLVALVLVGTFDPLVAWLERRGFRRGRALALIFLLIALALGAIFALMIPPLVGQLQHIIETAPAERHKLVEWLSRYKLGVPVAKTVRAVPLDDLVVRAGNWLLAASGDILGAIGYGVTTLFLALYLLADPGRAKGLIYVLVPRHQHVKLSRILLELKVIVGGYMRGQVITSVAIAVFTFGLLTAFHVDDALALAMFAGLTDVIPFIGGYLASAPAIAAVSGEGTAALLIVAAAMFLYQEFESRILVPRVYGRTLRLSPALVLVALLVGGTLLGILGALLALPVAAGMQMIVRELRVELPGEHIADAVRARDNKAERIYEQLTEGANVDEAVVIAERLAEAIKANENDSRKVSAELTAIAQKKDDD
jgi:predicted PurR-regulated permease PerM